MQKFPFLIFFKFANSLCPLNMSRQTEVLFLYSAVLILYVSITSLLTCLSWTKQTHSFSCSEWKSSSPQIIGWLSLFRWQDSKAVHQVGVKCWFYVMLSFLTYYLTHNLHILIPYWLPTILNIEFSLIYGCFSLTTVVNVTPSNRYRQFMLVQFFF